MVRPTSIDDYLRRYPHLCAALVGFSRGYVTPRGAADILRDAHQGQRNYSPWVEAGYAENPRAAVRDVVRYRTVQRHVYRQALVVVQEASRPPEARRDARPATVAAPEMTLVLTPEGFINIAQAVEFRLRYVDPTQSDAVSGIDVLLANGTSRLIEQHDPGFDQLIESFEDHGYTISVAGGGGLR